MNWRQTFSQVKAIMGIMHGSRAFGGPLQASISLTNRCNLRCVHCYFYSSYIERPTLPSLRRARQNGEKLPDAEKLKNIMKVQVDSGRVRNLVHEIIRMGTRRFQLGGHGEVFLHKDALEIMALMKHAGCYCFANTNGTLLDRAKIDELIRMGFDELRITIMAGTAEMYMRTHPGAANGTFDNLKNNLLYIAEQKASLGVRHPEITLVFIFIKQNFNGIFEFTEFASQVKADRIQYRPVDSVNDPGLANLVLTEEQSDSVRIKLPEVKEFLESKGIFHNINNFEKVFYNKLDTTALNRVIPCYYGWLNAMIDALGDVYPCCRCYKSFGNVNDMSFHEIWNGEAYHNFRRKALQINKRKKPVNGCDCNSCVHHTANLRIYKMLHPIKGRSDRLKRLCPALSDEGE